MSPEGHASARGRRAHSRGADEREWGYDRNVGNRYDTYHQRVPSPAPAAAPAVDGLLLHGYPATATRVDVLRAFSRNDVGVQDVELFREMPYEVRPEGRIHSGSMNNYPERKYVAAYVKTSDTAGALRMIDFINRGGPLGGAVTFRGAMLGAQFWNAPLPKHVRVPGSHGTLVTPAESERTSHGGPPASMSGDARTAKTMHTQRLLPPQWLSPTTCVVDVCGQMGRCIGKGGECVKRMRAETGCLITKDSDGLKMVVEGKSAEVVECAVRRVQDEVQKWLAYGRQSFNESAGRVQNKAGSERKELTKELPAVGAESTDHTLETRTPGFSDRRISPVSAPASLKSELSDGEREDGEIVEPSKKQRSNCVGKTSVPPLIPSTTPPPPLAIEPSKSKQHASPAGTECFVSMSAAWEKAIAPKNSNRASLAALSGIISDRQIPRDSLVRTVKRCLEGDGGDSARAAECSTSALQNLFVRYRVSKKLEPTGYCVSKIVGVSPSSADEEHELTPEGRVKSDDDYIHGWILHLDNGGATEGGGKESTTIALVSNVACDESEKNRWLVLAFASDADVALKQIRLDPIASGTARKRAAEEAVAVEATQGKKRAMKTGKA